jgi:hypothetical protein
MVLLTLRRTGGYFSAVLFAALFTALLLLLSGASASAAQVHHKRGHHSTKRRGAHGRAKRAGGDKPPGPPDGGLGQLSGILPRNHLTEESAIQVNLSNETVRLPLYPGTAPVPGEPSKTEKVWFVLLDASDQGLAHDLGELRAEAREHSDQ